MLCITFHSSRILKPNFGTAEGIASEALVSQDLMLEIKFFVGVNQKMLKTEVELLDGTVNFFAVET